MLSKKQNYAMLNKNVKIRRFIMKVIKIVNEKFGQNNYLIVNNETAILIDASANVGQIEENLKMYRPKPKLQAIFLTHEHFDHIAELDNLLKRYECNAYIHDSGKECLYKESENLSTLDSPFKIKTKRNVKTFKDSEEIIIGDIVVKCFHTPGHSKGSSCFVIEGNMFTGDTVFKCDVGRTDLFGGDEKVQKISLSRVLNELGQDITYFYSGHGLMFDREDLEYNLNRHLGDN